MKTCEEYVLKELEQTKNELYLVKKELEELKAPKEQEEECFEKVIKMSENPNYYYAVDIVSSYYFNEVLVKYNKNPDFLKDENNLEEFSKYIYDTSYSDKNVIKVEQRKYDVIIKGFNGNLAVITSYNNREFVLYNIDNKNFFLDGELAKKSAVEQLKESIKKYFDYEYDKKFKSKEELL